MKNVVRALILLALLAALMFAVPSGALIEGALAESAYPALSLEAEKGGLPLESGYDGLSYRDDTIAVTVEETRAYDTTILVAHVTVSDPSQIRTAMAGRYGSDTQAPGARLAKRAQAVFAINGDYFNFSSSGYVVRQGTLYRDNPAEGSDILLIDDQGDFHIVQDATSEKLAAFEGTVINSFSFGPALVADGEVVERRLSGRCGLRPSPRSAWWWPQAGTAVLRMRGHGRSGKPRLRRADHPADG